MSTTKPDANTGWREGVPQVNGDYFQRRGVAILGLVRIIDGDMYIAGHGGPRYVAEGSEFLGPVSPSDFEQLIRLRQAAVLFAIPYEALLMDAESKKWIAPKVWNAIENAVAALREALAPTGGKS